MSESERPPTKYVCASGIVHLLREKYEANPQTIYFYTDIRSELSKNLNEELGLTPSTRDITPGLKIALASGQITTKIDTTKKTRVGYAFSPEAPEYMENSVREVEKALREAFSRYPESMPLSVPGMPSNLTTWLARQGVNEQRAKDLESKIRNPRRASKENWEELRTAAVKANVQACLEALKQHPPDRTHILSLIENNLKQAKALAAGKRPA